MTLRPLRADDLSAWLDLSREYDPYIRQIHPEFRQWYEGDADTPSFTVYMESKIAKGEAVIAIDENCACLGIVAVSRTNHRISFFGVSHHAETTDAGQALLNAAFALLGRDTNIAMNVPKSAAARIAEEKLLAERNGFVKVGESVEAGCPVDMLLWRA